jgi:hypothetical protein
VRKCLQKFDMLDFLSHTLKTRCFGFNWRFVVNPRG